MSTIGKPKDYSYKENKVHIQTTKNKAECIQK